MSEPPRPGSDTAQPGDRSGRYIVRGDDVATFVIDLDRLDADLNQALTDDVRVHLAATGRPVAGRAAPAAASAPAPTPEAHRAPAWEHLDVEGHGRRVVELVTMGRMAEADLHIVAHADLAGAARDPRHRRDAAAWAVMRSLLDGRVDDARDGLDARPGGDDASALQRFAVAVASGDEDERHDVLDHCRQQAWVNGDRGWRARLALLLARLGRDEEARREVDVAVPECIADLPGPNAMAARPTSEWLDEATDLTEAAVLLGASGACNALWRALPDDGGMVVAGRAWVCKGPTVRFRAMAAAVAGRSNAADEEFAAAVAALRALGAPLLLAATLGHWGRSLAPRDPLRAAHALREEAAVRAALAPMRRPRRAARAC